MLRFGRFHRRILFRLSNSSFCIFLIFNFRKYISLNFLLNHSSDTFIIIIIIKFVFVLKKNKNIFSRIEFLSDFRFQ